MRVRIASRLRNPRTRRKLLTPVLVVALIVLLSGIYIGYRVGLEPVSNHGASQEFVVSAGDNAPTIARHLYAAGLIKSRTAFVTYINVHGLRGELKSGSYLLSPSMSGETIADDIAAGHTYSRRLLVPPGYRLSDIESSASELGISKTDFETALQAPHTQSFLATKPAGVDLEGYLYPDSYAIANDTTASKLVNEMLDNFGQHVGVEYVQAFAGEGLSLHQGLTIASIVEREVSNPADRQVVAQVFLKRFKSGMPLGSEVTARYAADLLGVPFTVSVESPYNTLTHTGLPPGPICSPGLSSIDAVAHQANTEYTYFFTDKNGADHFENTYEEQQANIAKFGLAGE